MPHEPGNRAGVRGAYDLVAPDLAGEYSPHLNKKEREWRYLKRDVRGHLARTLREFVDEIVDGLDRLGGAERLIVDAVPQWFLEGHRKAPTGRPAGRPLGAKDGRPRKAYTKRTNLPAST